MGKAHAIYFRSAEVKIIIALQAAGDHEVGLDKYFLEMSEPAKELSLPKGGITYAMDDPEHAITVGKKHGIKILSPKDTAQLLPHYPGFGVKRELI